MNTDSEPCNSLPFSLRLNLLNCSSKDQCSCFKLVITHQELIVWKIATKMQKTDIAPFSGS